MAAIDRRYRELKKFFFRPPVRAVMLFGPLANRTMLKHDGWRSVWLVSLHAASCHAAAFARTAVLLALEHCKLLQRSDRYENAAEIASHPALGSTLALQAQPAPAPAIQPKKTLYLPPPFPFMIRAGLP